MRLCEHLDDVEVLHSFNMEVSEIEQNQDSSRKRVVKSTRMSAFAIWHISENIFTSVIDWIVEERMESGVVLTCLVYSIVILFYFFHWKCVVLCCFNVYWIVVFICCKQDYHREFCLNLMRIVGGKERRGWWCHSGWKIVSEVEQLKMKDYQDFFQHAWILYYKTRMYIQSLYRVNCDSLLTYRYIYILLGLVSLI